MWTVERTSIHAGLDMVYKGTRMMRTFTTLTLAALVSLGVTSGAMAQVPLNKNTHINNQLFAAAVGDVIRNTCPTVHARMFTVMSKANALKAYARAQGYTEVEVKAFLKSDVEKARMNKLRDAYLAEQGAVPGDVESYCKVGRAEIEKGSLIGSLLWAR
jgi:hypothetical protein